MQFSLGIAGRRVPGGTDTPTSRPSCYNLLCLEGILEEQISVSLHLVNEIHFQVLEQMLLPPFLYVVCICLGALVGKQV